MATIKVEPMYTNQNGNAKYPDVRYSENTGNAAEPGRSFLVRFSNVAIPRGSTVTAANFQWWVSSKFPDQNSSANVTFQIEDPNASNPFRIGVQDDDRAWTTVWVGTINYTANAGASQVQNFGLMNSILTTKVNRADWTEGGHIAFRVYCDSETNDMSFDAVAGNVKTNLSVTFTPPGSPVATTVNLAENGNFNRGKYNETDPSSGEDYNSPYLWWWSNWWGSFAVEPTRTTGVTVDGLSAPFGGRVVKLTAPSATRLAIMHNQMNLYGTAGAGWYNVSAMVYVPAGVSPVKIENFSTSNSSEKTTVTGQWVQVELSTLVSSDNNYPLFAICTENSVSAGQSIYVANFCVVKGRLPVRGVTGGRSHATGVTYKYAGGTSTIGSGATFGNAVAEGTPPTTSITSWNNMGRRGGTNVVFGFSGNGPQSRYSIEWRKA